MRFLIKSAHFIFFTLFILSLIFYLERVAFIDSSYHLFKLINAQSLTYEAGRYGAFLTKWPALLLIKTGASLKVVMFVFSSWFILWYYLIFLFITYALKNRKVGIALAVSLVTGYGNTFFHCVTETHQALVYCLLFYAWISNKYTWHISFQIFFGIILIILSFLTHPISILVILTLLGFHLAKDNNYKEFFNYTFLIVIAVMVGLKLVFTDGNSYEGQFFDLKDIVTSFKTRMFGWVFYFRNILFLYFTPTLAFIVIVWIALKQKSLTSIYASFSSVVLLFLLILFYKGGADVMKERAILPFCTVIILFLTELFLKDNLDTKITKSYIIITSFIGIAVIFSMSSSHSKRISRYQTAFDSNVFEKTKKIIVPRKAIDNKNLMVTWSIPYETLLISAVEGLDKSKSIFPRLKSELNSIDITDNKLMLGAPFYLKHNASEINKNYFLLDDCGYIKLDSLPQ